MNTATRRPPHQRWLAAGATAAPVARGYHAVAVVGGNGEAAAAVARGIASAIAPARRVILADLVGDVPVLRDLSMEPDPEGVEDSFEFGISLARVAHHTPVENFMLLPSASDAVEREEIFRSGRWTRLARQCRASGWLLLVVARAGASGVDALVEQLDGVILLPGSEIGGNIRVLHRVDAPLGGRRLPRLRTLVFVTVAVLLVALAAMIALWRAYARPAAGATAPLPAAVTGGTQALNGGFAPQNPTDSAGAAAYAIEIMSANTRAGANAELRRARSSFPAATLGSATIGEARATWFRLIAGAFPEPRQADSLLRIVRESGMIVGTGGAVIRAPFALLVDSAASPAETPAVLARYHDRDVPAYALRQSDGKVFIYVGAFVFPQESASFADELNGDDANPPLVYRTGRVF